MPRALLSLLLAALSVVPANAADMRSLDVEYKDGRYTLVSEAWFAATVEQVFEVFRRWELSTQFSSTIIEARDEPVDDLGRPQYFIRNRGCVLFFCRSFERQGYVELDVNVVLRAFANPETSDFLLSNETWKFATENGGTVVSYQLLMKPKFWVPPGIGPYLIKRKLKSGGSDAIDRIEAIAQKLAIEPKTLGDGY